MLPSYSNRERVYDVLRGVAILGILLANIEVFARPGAMLEVFGLRAGPTTGVDAFIDSIRSAFVSGKFRGMLATLFGVGMAMLYAKALKTQVFDEWGRLIAGVKWPGPYLRRTFFMILLGALHGFFIWWGDVLLVYGTTALAASWVISQPKATQKLLFGLSAFITFVSAVGLSFLPWILQQASRPVSGGGQSSLNDLFASLGSPERDLAIYQSGTYLDQLLHRLLIFGGNVLNAPFLVPFMMVFFVGGAWLYQSGVLARPSKHTSLRNKLLALGLGVGLPLNLVVLAIPPGVARDGYALFIEMGASPLLALGYLILIAMAVEKSRGFWRPLELVGRFALTNYLLQSVLCSFIFYSFGGRLFGKLNALEQLGVVAGVWVVNLVFSLIWANRFDIGPVEWAWRSTVERRKLPWRTISPPPVAQMRDF